MSIWCSIPEPPAKVYVHSGYDPRKKGDRTSIGLAYVADYVYRENGNGDEILPYLRLSVGSESVILTEAQALRLIHELVSFRTHPKWRGKPQSELISASPRETE
jgi:ectoine hydroxylase-related dioxygenase (phytanoyl-CoA dioxygenase family)